MYDWMRDTTPEEEAEMKAAAWDLEEVKFGPVRDRYRQPSLVNDLKRHEDTLEEARSVEERVRAFNADERVRLCQKNSASLHSQELQACQSCSESRGELQARASVKTHVVVTSPVISNVQTPLPHMAAQNQNQHRADVSMCATRGT